MDGFSADNRTDRLFILTEFLNSQKPFDDKDKTGMYLEDIMQTWSFASQVNNDSILSLIPATLSILLRTISGVLQLVECGLLLGRTLLQKQQLLLFSRNLTANKSKAFIISPTLQLLVEIITFDGGVLAKQVFRARDFTFKSLPRNLGLRFLGDEQEEISKPSIRTNAVRVVRSLIKFCPLEAKKELLTLKDVISALTRDIVNDPNHLIIDVLDVLKSCILQDENLPREYKSKLLNPISLGRLVLLYNYNHVVGKSTGGKMTVSSAAHDFLMTACTSNEKGVLYKQSGFYPKGVDANSGLDGFKQSIDLGLDNIDWMDKYSEKVPVRNTTLSEFIQTLRPWSDKRQAELLTAIFGSAPELVADYFFNKKTFTFEPKLTATWIGYSAFLFSTIQLPVPQYLGLRDDLGKLPPPSSIVIESILPSPLNQKILTKCLHQASSLIKFFAIRILVVAFGKLGRIMALYRQAAVRFPIWERGLLQLVKSFSQRCPAMKDVMTVFRATTVENAMMRHATTRLLVLYYEVLPQTALESKFDISTLLTQTLALLDESCDGTADFSLRIIEAESLFQVALCSPGMRWFHRADSHSISPFLTMLKLSAQASSNVPLSRMRSILRTITNENGMLQYQTVHSSLDALIAALRKIQAHTKIDAVYDLLDDCALRCSSTPIKYIDAAEKIHEAPKENDTSDQHPPLSLILLVIAEQWPFVVKGGDQSTIEVVAIFLSALLSSLLGIQEDKETIKAIVKKIAMELPHESLSRKMIEKSRKDVQLPEHTPVCQVGNHESNLPEVNREEQRLAAEAALANVQAYDADDNSANMRWSSKEMEETIEDGHAAALLILLSSSQYSIRKEALMNISKLAVKIKASSYEEKEQIWLLLCETAETAKSQIESGPVPTTISVFAAQSIEILKNPLHCLYPKLMQFLTQGPAWQVDKIPLMQNILNEPPSIDDAYYRELEWLLTYLANSLRTEADLMIYYKRNVFEKLMTMYNNAYIAKGLKHMVLKVLYQASATRSGCELLVKRNGILSWLKAQDSVTEILSLEVLAVRILKETESDKNKIRFMRYESGLTGPNPVV